mmetsp:Transcript_20097/g.56530  ORF Transcript_20097/g.56530 Transcript_20097/m.56530 type:complete len:311 (-) Transcript_20097:536-1468(-)
MSLAWLFPRASTGFSWLSLLESEDELLELDVPASFPFDATFSFLLLSLDRDLSWLHFTTFLLGTFVSALAFFACFPSLSLDAELDPRLPRSSLPASFFDGVVLDPSALPPCRDDVDRGAAAAFSFVGNIITILCASTAGAGAASVASAASGFDSSSSSRTTQRQPLSSWFLGAVLPSSNCKSVPVSPMTRRRWPLAQPYLAFKISTTPPMPRSSPIRLARSSLETDGGGANLDSWLATTSGGAKRCITAAASQKLGGGGICGGSGIMVGRCPAAMFSSSSSISRAFFARVWMTATGSRHPDIVPAVMTLF